MALFIVVALAFPLAGQPPCNTPAIARDDVAAVTAGEGVLIDIFANDADAGGEPLTLSGSLGTTDCSSLGTANYNGDGTVTFAAQSGGEGDCSLSYTLAGGGSAAVHLTVEAAGVPDDPFGLLDEPPKPECRNPTPGTDVPRCCWKELMNAVRGAPVEESVTTNWDESPETGVFVPPGSENHAVLCQAAEYVARGEKNWYQRYMNAQKGFNPGQHRFGWMGTEVLSPLYGSWIVAANMAALDKALESGPGHSDLARDLESWLLTHWVMQALVAHDTPIHRAITEVQGGPFDIPVPSYFWDGLATVTAGARRLGNEGLGTAHPPLANGMWKQTNNFLMALALDSHPRNFGETDLALNDQDKLETFYAGLRTTLFLLGTDLDPAQRGTVDLEAITAPAEVFGLTDSQRETLRLFVESRGNQHPSVILDLLSENPTPRCEPGSGKRCCEMTFLRTTDGTLSYFGAGEHGLQSSNHGGGKQYVCNLNKPPHHAVRLDSDGTATILTPGNTPQTRSTDNTYESGNQICASYSTDFQSGDLCIDRPGGEVIYEVTWTTAAGLVVREYNPQSSEPPEAPTIDPHPAGLAVDQGDPATFQVSAQSVPQGRPLDYLWYKDGSPLSPTDPRFSGVANATLQIQSTVPGDSGAYHCRVTDRLEPTLFSDSNPAALTVTPDGLALEILTDPVNQSLNEGETATFSVTAQGPTGPDNLIYQWQRNGSDLVAAASGDFWGVRGPTLTVVQLHNSMEGNFRCIIWDVNDPSQTAASNSAALTVHEPRGPYGGSPRPIPGTVQVEHYDEGEPGEAYFDITPDDQGINDGNWHVRRDAVDFLTGASQAQIRWAYIAPGEFLKYTVELSEPGPFDVGVNYRTPDVPAEVDLTLEWGGASPGSETVTLLLPMQEDFLQQSFSDLFDNAAVGSGELTLTSRQTDPTTSGLQILWLSFEGAPPPQPDPPVANHDPVSGTLPAVKDEDLIIDTCLTLLENDVGHGDPMPCGSGTQPVTLEEIIQPVEGQVIVGVDQLIYRPRPGYSGADSFQYTVRDSASQVSAQPATVAIYVASQRPVAVDDTLHSMPQNGETTLRIYKGTLTNNDVAAHGLPIFSSLVGSPSNVTDDGDGVAYLEYTPPPGSPASDSFQYTVRDSYVLGNGPDSLPGTVTIVFTDDVVHPVANPDVFYISETRNTPRTSLKVGQIALTDNDQGSGNFRIHFPEPWNPNLGTFFGHLQGFNFDPAVGFADTVVFPYDLEDFGVLGNPTDSANITVHVVPFPVANPDGPFVVPHGTAVVIPADALVANDEHHGRILDTLLESSNAPAKGMITQLASGDFLYTPRAGEEGGDAFSYKVSDDLHSTDLSTIQFEGKADRTSAAALVTLEILPPSPVALDDQYLMPADQPELFIRWDELLLNDSPSGEVQVTDVYSPQYGTTSQVTSLGLNLPITRYAPGPGLWQTGADSFQYRIQRRDQNPPDTALGTVHLTPLVVSSPWVTDGFETGDLTAWSGTFAVGGTVDVHSKAALTGTLDLEVEVDPAASGTAPGSVVVGVHQDFDSPQTHLWLDFQLSLQGALLQVDPGDSLTLVNTLLSGESHLELKARAKIPPEFGFELQAVTHQDADAAATLAYTPWVDVGTGDRWVTLEWRASRAPGADDGALRFWLDHRLVDEKTGLDNDRKAISRVSIGAVKGIDEGTSGSILYDQISLWPGTDNRETLLDDKFETFLPGPWDRVVAYGGTLEVTSAAALAGNSGLALHIDPKTTGIPASSAALLLEETFDEPQNHLFVEFQFQVDPATFQMLEGEDFVLLPSYYAEEGHLEVRLRKSNGDYQLQFVTTQDQGVAPAILATSWLPIGTTAHWITLEWLAAAAPGSSDGALRVWIDHRLEASILGVDNDQKTIQRLRLGAVSRVDDGTSGRLFFDNVSYWRGPASRRNFHADNFEAGDLAAWDLGTGSVSATAGAGLLGAYGLQVDVTGTGSVGTVTDESPSSSSTYEVRFLLDTTSLTIGPSDRFVLFKGTSATGATVFEIKVEGGGGGGAPRIRPLIYGNTLAAPAWTPLSSGSQEVRFAWQATSAGDLVRFWVDDALVSTSAFDSGGLTLDAVEVGAVRAVDAGTTGTFAIDEFRSWE